MSQQQPTIVIDGFNLALEKGTGVATYGRNLSVVCRELGNRVDLLYGKPIRQAASALMTDIRFSDARPPNGRLASLRSSLAASLPTPFGLNSFQVPLTGDVIRRGREGHAPQADAIWNATNLFRRAASRFRLS